MTKEQAVVNLAEAATRGDVSCVYQILNKVNGKRYIGSAVSLRRRRRGHRSRLNRGIHHNSYLQNAWNLYGEESFVFELLEYVPDRGRLIEREQFFLDSFSPDYNLSPTAGSCLGAKFPPFTEEHKQKIAAALTGKTFTDEHRKNLSNAQKGKGGRKGKPHTEETKRKISEAKKGKKLTEEHKRKIGEAGKGRVFSEEHKRKIGENWKGRTHTEESKQKISEAKQGKPNGWSGRTHTEESKQKIREAKRQRDLARKETIS